MQARESMKVELKANQIKKILAEKNLSQNWLAYRIKTSTGYMSQLMGGSRNPSPVMRQKIQRVLKGYTFDDLFQIIHK